MQTFLSARVFKVISAFLLFVAVLSPTLLPGPVAAQSDDAPVDEVPLDQRLALEIIAPKDELSLGDEALVTLTATSAGTTAVEAVSLNLHSAPGITWSDDFKGLWLEPG